MAIRIAVDGKDQTAANNIVIYDDSGNAIAAVVDIGGGGIMFADASRDPADLQNILRTVTNEGVIHKVEAGPIIRGAF